VRVLVIENHPPLLRALRRGLEEEGYVVDTAVDGAEGDAKVCSAEHDAIVLDLVLPRHDGLTLIQKWRDAGRRSYILVLSTQSDIEDKVRALDLGADDYVTKPFQIEELLARLRALLRRKSLGEEAVLRVHDLVMDLAARTVERAGQSIHLTPREFALLQLLATYQGELVTRIMIGERLYEGYDETTSNVVNVHIRHLRKKIDQGFDVPLLHTRRGAGYMLRGPS
jgi:DNA-binding response OmpR family regulator